VADGDPAGGELAAWLRLLLTPGIGRTSARRLLAACGGVQAIWDGALAATRQRLCLATDSQAQALAREPPDFSRQLDITRRWLQAPGSGQRRVLLPLGHRHYPQALLHAPDPPLLLFVQGSAHCFACPALFPWPHALAVVGSRQPSAQGLGNARALAQALAEAGLCIVSGMALGIDAAAHEGALCAAERKPQAGAATIAVVGTGLDIVYPRQHAALAQRIAAHGLLVSEYPLGATAQAQHFPQRNRIIAALAQGTLVVEAAARSGSLITARLATEQGREVFAVPGSIHAPQSRGCHILLRQGAKLVEAAGDVLEELQGMDSAVRSSTTETPPPAAENPDPLLQALGWDPVPLDTLLARTGIDAARLQARLLELELDGQLQRLPGARFQRLARA